MKNHNTAKFPALGLELDWMDELLYRRYREKIDEGAEGGDTSRALFQETIFQTMQYFFVGEYSTANHWCEKAIDAAQYRYFESKVANRDLWTSNLLDVLGWGSVFSQWHELDTILSFARNENEADMNGEAVRRFLIGLAKWWPDCTELSWIEDVKKVRGAESKYHNALCDIVEAISTNQPQLLEGRFENCLKAFLKSDRGDFDFPFLAIFCYNHAKNIGLQFNVSQHVEKYMFSIPKS